VRSAAVQGKIAEQGRAGEGDKLVGRFDRVEGQSGARWFAGWERADGRDGFGLNQPCGFGGA
jgi:hypothetical protein